jgi:hypothetical protein
VNSAWPVSRTAGYLPRLRCSHCGRSLRRSRQLRDRARGARQRIRTECLSAAAESGRRPTCRGGTGLLTYSLESTQPQVLELLRKSQTLLGGDRPELIADYATSLDRPITIDTSEKAPRAISQLYPGLAACWAHRHEGSRIEKQAISLRPRCPAGDREVNYFCCHFGPLRAPTIAAAR